MEEDGDEESSHSESVSERSVDVPRKGSSVHSTADSLTHSKEIRSRSSGESQVWEEKSHRGRREYSEGRYRSSEESNVQMKHSYSEFSDESRPRTSEESYGEKGKSYNEYSERSKPRASDESYAIEKTISQHSKSRLSGSEESNVPRRSSYRQDSGTPTHIKDSSERDSHQWERDTKGNTETTISEGSDADGESQSSVFSEEHGEVRDGYHLLTSSQEKIIIPFAKRWIKALENTRRKIFESIDPHIVYKLVYPDYLEVFVDDESVGEFTVIMGRIRRSEGPCIMIHANSHAIINGIKCGSDITTVVTMKLETVQHVYHDYVELPNKVVDNKLVVVRDEENYFVKKISFDGDKAEKKTEKIPRRKLTGYVSEGACFLLHRYFLKTQRRVPVCLNNLDMNLQRCSVTFTPVDEAAQLVQGTLLYTLGMLQTTMNLDGATDTWITYYNRIDLHMTRRQQFGSPTEMLLVRLPVGLGRPAPDFMSDWEGNPQLWSHFVERKASIMTEYLEYLHKHDEIKALLSDFLLFLLHRKPSDICDAAAYFFNDFLKDY